MEKSKSGIIIIMMAVVSMLLLGATGMDPKKMTEAEIEALLKPEQYIAVDTLGGGVYRMQYHKIEIDTLGHKNYIIKFMNGDKVTKELELKIGFKEYKSESLSVRIDHSAKIEGKIFDIRTVSYRKDSIYLNPTIHLSPDKTKIAIRWENLIKRNNCEVEKIYELDSIMKTTNNRTGLRNVNKIEVYNEEGKKMYEVNGAEAGWEESVDEPALDNDFSEVYCNIITNPYAYIEQLSDNGTLIISNSIGQGLLLKSIRIISKDGNIVLTENVRASIKMSDLKEFGNKIYFNGITAEGLKLFIMNNKGLENSLLFTKLHQSSYAWLEEYYNGKVVLQMEEIDDVWNKDVKLQKEMLIIIGKNNKIEREIELDLGIDGISSTKPYWTGEELLLCGVSKETKEPIAYRVTEKGELEKVKNEGENGKYVIKVVKTDGGSWFYSVDDRNDKEYKVSRYDRNTNTMKGIMRIKKERVE